MSEMKQRNKSIAVSDNVMVDLTIDVFGVEELDTRVVIDGEFWVGGSQYDEFCKKLGALIDEYRI